MSSDARDTRRGRRGLLGHASPVSTALYTLVDDSDLRAAVLGLPGLAAVPLRLDEPQAVA